MTAALQKVHATSSRSLLILITRMHMHISASLPQLFFVLLVTILGMVGQYWPAANPYPHTPVFHLYPHSFVGGGGWCVCVEVENSVLLIALRGQCDIVVHLAVAEKRGLQSIISDLRRLDSSIELQSPWAL